MTISPYNIPLDGPEREAPVAALMAAVNREDGTTFRYRPRYRPTERKPECKPAGPFGLITATWFLATGAIRFFLNK